MRTLNFEDDVSMIALTDLDRATRTALIICATFEVNGFLAETPYVAVAVKHGNACGAAVGRTKKEAIIGMIEGSPSALFGGSVVTNFDLDPECADLLRHHYRGETRGFRALAGVAAPDMDAETYEILFRKSRALVALKNPALTELGVKLLPTGPVFRHLPLLGAVVAQEADTFLLNFKDERLRYEWEPKHWVTDPFGDEQTLRDIALSQSVGWTSNSNTITIACNNTIRVNSVGGQERVGAADVAGHRLIKTDLGRPGLVASSDSFFLGHDSLLTLKRYGVNKVFTTQGGEREREVAEWARANYVALMWIPDKVGRGFYGH
jgi:phosphoribosylaminoimidazolecarboxamide formyltransferase/IMP cyclohydrolase